MLPGIILGILVVGSSFGALVKWEPPKLDHRIVGGTVADIRDHPYQSSLQTSRHVCGASIIDRKWILTAAHCVKSVPGMYRVAVGSNDKYNGTYYDIKTVVRHPNYDPTTIDYDVAILEIDGEIEFNERVRPVKLAETELATGSLVNITGWGAVKQGGAVASVLMRASIPIVDRASCQNAYRYLNKVTERMICAGYAENGGKDSCQGDSGGPLTADGLLYGIVSWGYGCAKPNYPGVYGNVANFRAWIKEISGV